MKKHFIADVLTASKLIPAVCILAFIQKIDSGIVFILFGIGELLDALDGMAAKQWPHPPETDSLWFRKHIKIIESGLDMILGIAALIYITVRIDLVGAMILVVAFLTGTIMELLLYGRLFGTPETAKNGSLFKRKPEYASAVVGWRLIMYLGGIATIILILIWYAPWSITMQITVTAICAVIAILVGVKKLRDGRLVDVLKFFGKD